MKRIVAALIVVIMCFMLSACSFPTYKTPLMWCVLDVLHNEPYADGEAIDGWQYEKLYLPNKENEYYSEYCYIITVSYINDYGDIQFDYWYCIIATKQRCVHNIFDYIRDKNSDDAGICSDCIAIIDCNWFKSEIGDSIILKGGE